MAGDRPWVDYCEHITSVHMDSTVKPQSLAGWFAQCTHLTSVDARNWDLSSTTSLYNLFDGCTALRSFNGNGCNTQRVNNMASLFNGCVSLTAVDLGGWTSSNVIMITGMFSNCSSLPFVDVSSWDISKCKSLGDMFYNCSSLKSLDVEAWNTVSCTSLGRMFSGCASLESIPVDSWDTASVRNIGNMFSRCTNLKQINLQGWNTSNVTEMGFLFAEDTALISIRVASWDTSSCEVMRCAFQNCSALPALDLSSWDTAGTMKMADLFSGCSALAAVSLGTGWTFEPANVKDGGAVLPEAPQDTSHTGLWQAVGIGTHTTPRGTALSAVALAATYVGSTMADTYVWQPRLALTGTVLIGGTPIVGDTLQAFVPDAPADAVIGFAWFRTGEDGAADEALGEGADYRCNPADYGRMLYAVATDTRGAYTDSLRSSNVVVGAHIDVTVPVEAHFKARLDGSLICPTDATIVNHSLIDVRVVSLTGAATAAVSFQPNSADDTDAIALTLTPGAGGAVDFAACIGEAYPLSGDAWLMKRAGVTGVSGGAIPLSFTGSISSFNLIDPAADISFAHIIWTVSGVKGGG